MKMARVRTTNDKSKIIEQGDVFSSIDQKLNS